MVNLPKVSVIVPVYNAIDTLADCISSLTSVDWPKESLELIFVDDGSQDGGAKIIEGAGEIKLIKQANTGPAGARNNGWKNASGDIIVFTDSDCIVPADWIKNIVEGLRDSDVLGGAIIPEKADSRAEIFEQKRRERLYGVDKKFVTELPSCNLAFKKKILDEVNGFETSFKKASAEDYHLCAKVIAKGYKILYDPKIKIIHKHSADLAGIYKRAYMHGEQIIKYRKLNGGNPVTEFFRIIVKAPLIPYFTLTRYPLNLTDIGVKYEILSFFGNIQGFLKFWVNI